MKHRTGTRSLVLASAAFLLVASAAGNEFRPYYDHAEFSRAAPGASGFGQYGFTNPANLHYVDAPDFTAYWTSDSLGYNGDRWGTTLASPGFSATFLRDNRQPAGVTDQYQLAFGGGSDAAASGFAASWYRGSGKGDLRGYLSFGTITRPSEHFSVGAVGRSTTDFDDRELVLDAAWRPTGTARLSLFADTTWSNLETTGLPDWSAGATTQLRSGLALTGRYFSNGSITASVGLRFGPAGWSSQAHLPESGSDYMTHRVRLGAYEPSSITDALPGPQRFVEIQLNRGMVYQRLVLFDRRATLLDTLDNLEQARRADDVAGVIINATQADLNASMTWELVRELNRVREAGKQVVVYVERGGMNMLHLMAAADTVVMDPFGTLSIPGLVSGNTYLGELFDELGIGVDELRSQEFKSAFEYLAREDMSAADRRQRQLLLDDFYEQIRRDVVAGRGITAEEFDALIENGLTVSSAELATLGLVDHRVRYTRLNTVLAEYQGQPPLRTGPIPEDLLRSSVDEVWGPSARIAVVYASGATSTDSGMRARAVAATLREARRRPDIRSVVLRVDSPGGDVLAADMVADEVRRLRNTKPVVVSMGSYAASGGYWIATYGRPIIATPMTTTGSIGVISAHLWDDGFSDQLYLNADSVQRGPSADTQFGVTLPLLGLTLPGRAYTEEERERAMAQIEFTYNRFLNQVSEGRGESVDWARERAGGRVFSGRRAQQLGLVDGIGNLQDALNRARREAGLTPEDKVEIIEGPSPEITSVRDLLQLVESEEPMLIAPFRAEDWLETYLNRVLENNGEPQVIIPLQYL